MILLYQIKRDKRDKFRPPKNFFRIFKNFFKNPLTNALNGCIIDT
nr:MAG TPA: hypothetical protein [Caudoviricetes sp.]